MFNNSYVTILEESYTFRIKTDQLSAVLYGFYQWNTKDIIHSEIDYSFVS